MSLTVEQLLIDAKKLANRLKDDESKADNLINQARSTHNHIEAMKQYTEDVEKLNEAASQRPHSVLVQGLKRENMRELYAENRGLRIALAEYQKSVKLIMSKYRQQISQLVKASEIDISTLHNNHCSRYSKVILDQYSKMDKMKRVMKEALNLFEGNALDKELKAEELITRLMTENKGLREVIDIYRKYGCQQPSLEPGFEIEPQQQQLQQTEQPQQHQEQKEQEPSEKQPTKTENVLEKKDESEKQETPSADNQ